MASEERKEIPLPKDFSAWSVEKQQGFFKGYRYGRKRQEEDPDSMPAVLEDVYPYNFLCRAYEKNPDMAFVISPAEFEVFCNEELDDQETGVLLFLYEEGISSEATGKLLNMTSERVRQNEAKIVRKVRTRFPEPVQNAVSDPEEVIPDPEPDQNDLTLQDLHLSTRAMTVLKKGNIKTVKDLTRMTDFDLYRIRGCGPAVMEEIKNRLSEHGLSLKDLPY